MEGRFTKVRVWINGTFDVLHIGHIKLLEFASQFGEVRVGIDTDERVKKLKGELRPINTIKDRIDFMNSIKYVHSSVDFSTEEKESISKLNVVEDLHSILTIYKKTLDLEFKKENSVVSTGLFYMEKQLEDFIVENWESTQLGKELDLIYEEGSLKSQQFRTDIGPIDILAKDKKSGEFVVIELKKNQSSDDTVGQILRYMGWVKEKLSDTNVRGIVVAGKYDERLDYARKMIPGLEVFIYEVQFNLKEYKK